VTSESVYVIGAVGTSKVKIGRSTNVANRHATLQRMSPLPLALLWQTTGGSELEAALHAHFRERRTHGEWFDFGEIDPVSAIAQAAVLIADQPTMSAAECFKRYKRARETRDRLRPLVEKVAIRDMRSGKATAADLAQRTGLAPEVFRKLARAHGIERLREPTVGKDAPKRTSPNGD
jgi:Meiotically Up-regulated Gene 113 (MUG113) protein